MKLAAESVLSKVPVKCDANVGDSWAEKMNLITVWLPENEKRDVFTAKTDSGYVGCVKTDKCMIMTKEHYANL